jgi:hypothetical protein
MGKGGAGEVESTPPQRVPTSPPPLRVGRNHLKEEIIHLLPTGIAEIYTQTISNLGHAALLRRYKLPL